MYGRRRRYSSFRKRSYGYRRRGSVRRRRRGLMSRYTPMRQRLGVRR